jgi:hypothetical protein|tara:strand:+ start:115 stop:471 length:357 start_codon:yes stop_codon:yes gene_type:complete
MTFDASKHMLDKQQREVTLSVGDEEFVLTIRPLPWSRKRQITSLAMSWGTDSETSFNGDYYMKEVLKYIIVKAPWGATTELFLAGVDEELGSVLETLVADAGKRDANIPSAEIIKKDS